MSFIEKDLGFLQTRDQEQLLPIALFKFIKLQLTRKLELTHFLKPKYIPAEMHQKPFFSQRENRPYVKMCVLSL